MKCEHQGCRCEENRVQRGNRKFCSERCAEMEMSGTARADVHLRPPRLRRSLSDRSRGAGKAHAGAIALAWFWQWVPP